MRRPKDRISPTTKFQGKHMKISKKAGLAVAALLGLSVSAHAADIDTAKRIRVAMVPKLIGL